MPYEHLPAPVMPRVPPQRVLLGQITLAEEVGADVAINYVTVADKAEALAAMITAKGGRAIAVRAHVDDASPVQVMFREAIAQLATIYILVNNAELQQDASFYEIDTRAMEAGLGSQSDGSVSARTRGSTQVNPGFEMGG